MSVAEIRRVGWVRSVVILVCMHALYMFIGRQNRDKRNPYSYASIVVLVTW